MQKMEQGDMDLRGILKTLRRRVLLVILIPAVAAGLAALVSFTLLTPVYSAQTTLWVTKDGAEQSLTLSDLQLTRNLAKTYAEMARSRAVMADVIERMHLTGVTVRQLQQKVSVAPVGETELLSITIEDTDPDMAAGLANSVAAAFQAQISAYRKVETVVVVDVADMPTAPIKPRPASNIAISLVLGLAAAAGLAFLLEYLDTTIKSDEDITRHLNIPVLGIIPVFDVGEIAASDGASRGARKRMQKAKTVVEP